MEMDFPSTQPSTQLKRRPVLTRQNAVIEHQGYSPPVEELSPPSSPTKGEPMKTPDTPFADMSLADGLQVLMKRRERVESLLAMCEEGDTSHKFFEEELASLKEEIQDLMSSSMKDHGTPRRKKVLQDMTVKKKEESKIPTPATQANCAPLQGKKGGKKSSVVRKVPTDFKVVNLTKKKKRFDGMTFKLDNNFFVGAKEVYFGKTQNCMEAITIERHFTVKHPNNDGSMIPKISPMNIPRRVLDPLITAVRAIVKSNGLDIENMPPPIPGRDGVFDLSYMTKGVYTSDRFVLDPMLSLQIEEIQFSNARGTGNFDVLAITKTLNTIDKATKKNKTFVQQIPVRLLPGLLRALTTIAKHTRDVDKIVDKEHNVEEVSAAEA